MARVTSKHTAMHNSKSAIIDSTHSNQRVDGGGNLCSFQSNEAQYGDLQKERDKLTFLQCMLSSCDTGVCTADHCSAYLTI